MEIIIEPFACHLEVTWLMHLINYFLLFAVWQQVAIQPLCGRYCKRIIHFTACVWVTSRQMQTEGVGVERWRGKNKLSSTGKIKSSTSLHKQCQTSMFIPSHSRITSYSIFMIALSTLVLMFQIMGIPPFPLRASSAVWCCSSLGSFPWYMFPLPFLFPSNYSKLYPLLPTSPLPPPPPFNFHSASTFQIFVGSYVVHPLLLLSKLSKHGCNLSL